MLGRALALSLPLLVSVSVAHATDDEWGSGEESGGHLEISHQIGLGAIWTEQPPYFTGSVEVALVAYLEREMARDDRDEPLVFGLVLGDTIGLAPRAMILANGSDVAAPWAAAVGGGLVFRNRIADSAVRVPTILGSLLPEIGAMFRAATAPAFYLAWEAPFSIRMDRRVAMDVVFRVYAIDDWLSRRVEEPNVDPWNYVLTVGLGVRLIE